jgi:hypothetical protein
MEQLYNQLTSRGIVTPDDRFSSAQVADIHDYLRGQKLWLGGHWVGYARPSSATTEQFMANPDYSRSFACYGPGVAARAPHLAAKAREYTALAAAYFSAKPSLFDFALFWSFPGGPVSPQIQEWHRDACTFDDRQFAMFAYLTDVDGDGAHRYTARDGSVVEVTGPAGTIFVEDPSALHMGRKPVRRCRLMACARFGLMVP